MNRILSAVLIVIAAAAVGLVLFFNSSMKKPAKPAGRTATVQRGDIILKVTETGSLEPLGVVEIKSEQSGEIKRLFVKPGERVAVGQKLAVIQQESGQARQAAQLRAGYEEERLNMDEARRDMDRQRALFEKGFISRKELEAAEKKFEQSRLKWQLARRQLLLALGGSPEVLDQYLARDIGSDSLDQFAIASPIRGTVISLEVEEGEMITSGTSTVGGGTALMTIADLSRMLVKAKINEVNIAQVRLGLPVEIRLDAVPGKRYQATVTQISPQGERLNNVVTYFVTMEIADPDEDLKPSMTANVDILLGVSKNALSLPVEALARQDGRPVVTVEENGRPVKKPVTVGARTETSVEITSGLNEGDRVLILPNETAKE
ncbi:MAG: efflux RND transporter periplasmic adaptor subunit [Nitrospirae bacterium]|nr:efflux RND transporter periplasmic adaptor subunit [Nitrospirota bacterium]